MLSLSLAIVCEAFPKEEQPRAVGIWAAVSAIALAIGPLVGGAADRARLAPDLLDQSAVRGRRVAITWSAARESRDESAGRGVDVPGLLALTPG